MKKISAHYWLRPDGSIGKFPIITFDKNNRIVEIRERDAFKEEASLLLINGFLIPGLVDFAAASLLSDELSTSKKYLNRCYIQGIRALGVPPDVYAHLKKASLGNILLVETDIPGAKQDLAMGFEKIQTATDSLSELMNLTIHNAKAMGIECSYGSLQVGKSPGLLAISNLDYNTFNIDENTKLKGIV